MQLTLYNRRDACDCVPHNVQSYASSVNDYATGALKHITYIPPQNPDGDLIIPLDHIYAPNRDLIDV